MITGHYHKRRDHHAQAFYPHLCFDSCDPRLDRFLSYYEVELLLAQASPNHEIEDLPF